MVYKCVVVGCRAGYDKTPEHYSSFRFPFDKPILLQKWCQFVNRADWIPTKYSVICLKHFETKFIRKGQRTSLIWNLNPVPSIHVTAATISNPAPKTQLIAKATNFQSIPTVECTMPSSSSSEDDFIQSPSLSSGRESPGMESIPSASSKDANPDDFPLKKMQRVENSCKNVFSEISKELGKMNSV